jgi:hypothetical protein
MISRKKKYLALLFMYLVLLVVLVVNVKFQRVNQNYLLVGLFLSIVLMWFAKPTYSDFDFEIKWAGVNESKFLTKDWSLVYETLSSQGPVFTLVKKGKKVSSYLIRPTPFPHRISFLDGLDEVDLLIISSKKVFAGKYYEEIPYGGVGVAVRFMTKDEKVVFETIKRKGVMPWYKLVLGRNS